MIHSEVVAIMKEMKIPFAYDHFAEGEAPDPPFINFLYPRSDNFAADGSVYYKKNVLNIELYGDKKSTELENKVETMLDKHGLFYNKSEVWIESERLYEVLYQMEV